MNSLNVWTLGVMKDGIDFNRTTNVKKYVKEKAPNNSALYDQERLQVTLLPLLFL